MKEFNLEEAKQGKPVYSEDGQGTRIIRFDRENKKLSIVALDDDCKLGEVISEQAIEDKFYEAIDYCYSDLILATDKREGWINIYSNGTCDGHVFDTESEAKAFAKKDGTYVTTTIKVEW